MMMRDARESPPPIPAMVNTVSNRRRNGASMVVARTTMASSGMSWFSNPIGSPASPVDRSCPARRISSIGSMTAANRVNSAAQVRAAVVPRLLLRRRRNRAPHRSHSAVSPGRNGPIR